MALSSESPTRHFWLVLFSTALTVAISGIIVGLAYIITFDRQQQRQNHDRAGCRVMIHDMSDESVYSLFRQPLVAICSDPLDQALLATALQHQLQSQHVKAIMIAEQVQGDSDQRTAQQLIERSSRHILDDAEDRYLSVDITGYADAIRLASSLKPENPLFPEAQELIRNWQQEWSINQRYWKTADQARREGNLSTAEQAAKRISSHPFWLRHRSDLLTKIIADQKRYPNPYV